MADVTNGNLGLMRYLPFYLFLTGRVEILEAAHGVS